MMLMNILNAYIIVTITTIVKRKIVTYYKNTVSVQTMGQ